MPESLARHQQAALASVLIIRSHHIPLGDPAVVPGMGFGIAGALRAEPCERCSGFYWLSSRRMRRMIGTSAPVYPDRRVGARAASERRRLRLSHEDASTLRPVSLFDPDPLAFMEGVHTENDSSLGLVSIQASTTLTPGDTDQAVTFNVKPGLTYYVAVEQEVDKGAVPRAFGSFTSGGTANGATAPAAAATVRLQGLRFRGTSTLPRNGVVRFENRDGVAHFALAFPLRKGVTSAKLGTALASSSQSAFGKLIAGNPYMAQNVISGGDTIDYPEASFAKKGKYAFVCFIEGHDRLGMYRIITVK